jgi:hypothetical protein
MGRQKGKKVRISSLKSFMFALEGWRLFLELSSPSWRSRKKKFVLFLGLSHTYGQSQADVDRPTLGTQTYPPPPAVVCRKFKNVQ